MADNLETAKVNENQKRKGQEDIQRKIAEKHKGHEIRSVHVDCIEVGADQNFIKKELE